MNDRDKLVADWLVADQALQAAKDSEMSLRKQVLAAVFDFKGEADDREGTSTDDLGNGYKLKGSFKQNRTLNAEKVESVLAKMEKSGAEGAFLAERVVKWKAELSITEYRNLPEKFKKMIDEIMTQKAGTPSLEFVAPKAK